jgi:hypothetical protein
MNTKIEQARIDYLRARDTLRNVAPEIADGFLDPAQSITPSTKEYEPGSKTFPELKRTSSAARKGRKKAARKERGIFEKVPGSEVWWIRYSDATGRIRREKAGLKQAAITLYRKRKTEVLQGRQLPETIRRREVLLVELLADAAEHIQHYYRGQRLDADGKDYRYKTLKTIAMTCRYAHLAPQHQLEAISKLDGWGQEFSRLTDTKTDTGDYCGSVDAQIEVAQPLLQ